MLLGATPETSCDQFSESQASKVFSIEERPVSTLARRRKSETKRLETRAEKVMKQYKERKEEEARQERERDHWREHGADFSLPGQPRQPRESLSSSSVSSASEEEEGMPLGVAGGATQPAAGFGGSRVPGCSPMRPIEQFEDHVDYFYGRNPYINELERKKKHLIEKRTTAGESWSFTALTPSARPEAGGDGQDIESGRSGAGRNNPDGDSSDGDDGMDLLRYSVQLDRRSAPFHQKYSSYLNRHNRKNPDGLSGPLGNYISRGALRRAVAPERPTENHWGPYWCRPQRVGNMQGTAFAVTSGFEHNLVVGSDGRVFTWGNGASGQLGHDPNQLGNFPQRAQLRPVHSLSGYEATMQPIMQAAAGGYHNMALNMAGEVYTWGIATDGRLGYGETAIKRLGVGEGGKDMCYPSAGIVPYFLTSKLRVSQVACGHSHSLAIAEGELFTWGDNSGGKLGLGDFRPRAEPCRVHPEEFGYGTVLQVAGGVWHSIALVSTEEDDAAAAAMDSYDAYAEGFVRTEVSASLVSFGSW